MALLHSAQEVARLLPARPAEYRKSVFEALAVTEIALLRFKMEMPSDPPTLASEDLN